MPEILAVLVLAAGSTQAPSGHAVGRPASAEEVRQRDITVMPDGAGLPRGQGRARQGKALYMSHCAVCHGAHGEGQGDYPPVAGGHGSLITDKPVPTVGAYWPYATTVWDYIRRGMPYDHPGILSANQVYAITAFVLHLNGIVSEDELLDEQTLPKVKMPNRDGFVPDPRPDVGPTMRVDGPKPGVKKKRR